ncbi:MAG: hypothetical protein M1833_003365 [Piccolia ochrophora]|nr:MAG: hypothetical protein M1833_003365 [Piccolia ochrophora]
MRIQPILQASLCSSVAHGAETVLGVYIFSRHGDRTPKAYPPTELTDLGYAEVHQSGQYFRSRYIDSSASSQIVGIEPQTVQLTQISVQAPVDNVLMISAQAFLQGLYPPVGREAASETLTNGTTVSAPLDGYQLIPIYTSDTGASSEDQAWLQGATGCAKAQTSSNAYFSSQEYAKVKERTDEFYQSLAPVINDTFSGDKLSYRNAYSIFDVLHVASIHNATIPNSELLTDEVLFQAQTLADEHEFNLAFNASDTIRGVSGATLAAQVVESLNKTVTSNGQNKIGIQFGAYASFQSFFGLSRLTEVDDDFYGIPDYASSMSFELFTDGPASSFPPAEELRVRFLFHNGTSSNESAPVVFPLFGQQDNVLSWTTFIDE